MTRKPLDLFANPEPQLFDAPKAKKVPERHLYRPMLRPAAGCTLPSIVWEYAEMPANMAHLRADIPCSRHLYGVIATMRRLTVDECARFDLQPVLDSENSRAG